MFTLLILYFRICRHYVIKKNSFMLELNWNSAKHIICWTPSNWSIIIMLIVIILDYKYTIGTSVSSHIDPGSFQSSHSARTEGYFGCMTTSYGQIIYPHPKTKFQKNVQHSRFSIHRIFIMNQLPALTDWQKIFNIILVLTTNWDLVDRVAHNWVHLLSY